jgi:hypothetical protein
MNKIHGNTKVHGICNVAFHNRSPKGDQTWYAFREKRDAVLKRLREHAIDRGLNKSAAHAGIYPIQSTVATLRSEGVDIDATLAGYDD